MSRKYFWTFLALILIYITLAFALPSDPEVLKKYEISQAGARWLNVTLIAPLVVVYFSAFYGFLRFKSYANSVAKTKEGPPLTQISIGLMILAYSLPASSIFGSLLNYLKFQHTDLIAAFTIGRNYIILLLSFLAFIYIARGAANLVGTLKDKKIPSHPVLSLAGPIMATGLFTWLITTHPDGDTTGSVYYMPDIVVIVTLAVPYVYLWSIAIGAVHKLYFYKNRVRGLIYKRAMDYVMKGILVITILSILVQVILTLSGQLNRLNLTPLLLVIYVLIVLYALGYGFVARGAKKLKQIEEV